MIENTGTVKTIVVFILLALGMFGYLAWLDSGCESGVGAMTWSGKVCFEDL